MGKEEYSSLQKHTREYLQKQLELREGVKTMANENPGLEAMRQATANQSEPQPGKEAQPVNLLTLANKELDEEVKNRIVHLTQMLSSYLTSEPPSPEAKTDDPPGDPVLIMRLIKHNRSSISTINEMLDRLIARLSY